MPKAPGASKEADARRMDHKTREEPPNPKTGESPRQAAVDDRAAEALAGDFPAFGVVEIRAALEFEALKAARAILRWASSKKEPSKGLRNFARKRRTGYHRPRRLRPPPQEEYLRSLAFLKRKEAEHLEKRGSSLTQGQIEDLSRLFFAPEYRADMERVTPAQWDDYHRQSHEDEDAP